MKQSKEPINDPVVVGWLLDDGNSVVLSRSDIPQICSTTLIEYTRVLQNAERMMAAPKNHTRYNIPRP